MKVYIDIFYCHENINGKCMSVWCERVGWNIWKSNYVFSVVDLSNKNAVDLLL